MNQRRHLDQLWRVAQKRYRRLRAESLKLAVSTADPEARRRRVPLLMIDGINQWSNFARSFFLSSALGCRSQGGRWIVGGGLPTARQREVIVAAIHAAAPRNVVQLPPAGPIDRRLEPTWSDPNVLIQAGQAIGLTNQQDIINAFSPFPGFIVDWLCVRNFYAHRNADAYESARTVLTRHGVVFGSDVSEWMLRAGLAGYRPLLVDWCLEMELRCEYLCV